LQNGGGVAKNPCSLWLKMNEGIIDFHTHAFPDELAPRAMKKLMEETPEATNIYYFLFIIFYLSRR